jgi:DNA polymerase-4
LNRNIIHIHIPAFSIAVARVCRPELRERPVAVAPLHSERALILASSSEARDEGIYKGMPLGKATKFCSDLTVIPPDPGLTEKAHQVLTSVAARYTPLWEPSRPGHIHLDVTGTERLWGRAKDTAARVRREIKGDLRLAGTAGVASNKMVSSIASRIFRSEEVLDVDHGQESLFMAPLKVDMLPGIGHVRRRILLEELNISLVREIAVMDMGSLRLVFGRQAYVIHQRAIGIDPTPVYPPRMKPTVAEEVTLPRDENDDEKLLGILYGLVEKCANRLRSRSLLPRKAGLVIRYADQQEITRRIHLPQLSFWDFDLYGPLEELFFKACRRRVRVRFMKVWFRDFSHPSSQLSLFSAVAPDREKKVSVTQALDNIRGRFGGEAIQYGRTA